MKTRGKLRHQLFGLLALSIIVPVSAISLYSISSSSRALVDLASDQMKLEGTSGAEKIDIVLNSIQSDVLYLSGTPPIQGILRAKDNNGIDPADNSTYESWITRLNTIFSSFLEVRDYYYQLRYIDELGNEITRANVRNGKVEVVPDDELQNKASSDYFRETMQLRSGELYVSPINLNREHGKIEEPHIPVIRYATPVYDSRGRARGILIANVLVEPLFEIAANQELQQKFDQQFFVVNQEGDYLSHPDPGQAWGFEFGKENSLFADYSSTIASQILSGDEGLLKEGKQYLLSYHTVLPNEKTEKHPFILVYRTPEEAVLAPVAAFRTVALMISMLCLGLTAAFGTKLLQQLIGSVTNLMGVVSSFSQQVLSTVNEQERISSQQASSVQETTVTMDQLSVSAKQSAEQANSAASGAKQALEQVKQGTAAVDRTIEEMETLKEKVTQIAQQVLQLNQQAIQINSISALVSNLANQTNMLALNAAVEAVRAGDAGKGFSVVAAEIRKLSDESQKSGQRISELVNDVQSAIRATATVTEQGTRNVETGVEAAEQSAEVFAEINAAIAQVVENSQQIALNSSQQASAIQQVTFAMNQLTQGAAETAKGIQQTKQGTEQLNHAASQLHSIV